MLIVARQSLMTSTQAAKYLGVSPASIKRWADAGVLTCHRTAGNHRRFSRWELDRFRMRSLASGDDFSDEWLEALRGSTVHSVQARLLESRSRLGSWWLVAERLRPLVQAIHLRAQSHEISAMTATLAAQRLSRGLQRVAEGLPVHPTLARCIVANADGDSDMMEGALAELCLREVGWHTFSSLHGAPDGGLAEVLDAYDIRMVVLTASSLVADAQHLEAQARRVAAICRPVGVSVLMTGRADWPEEVDGARIVRGFEAFHAASLQHLPKDQMQ